MSSRSSTRLRALPIAAVARKSARACAASSDGAAPPCGFPPPVGSAAAGFGRVADAGRCRADDGRVPACEPAADAAAAAAVASACLPHSNDRPFARAAVKRAFSTSASSAAELVLLWLRRRGDDGMVTMVPPPLPPPPPPLPPRGAASSASRRASLARSTVAKEAEDADVGGGPCALPRGPALLCGDMLLLALHGATAPPPPSPPPISTVLAPRRSRGVVRAAAADAGRRRVWRGGLPTPSAVMAVVAARRRAYSVISAAVGAVAPLLRFATQAPRRAIRAPCPASRDAAAGSSTLPTGMRTAAAEVMRVCAVRPVGLLSRRRHRVGRRCRGPEPTAPSTLLRLLPLAPSSSSEPLTTSTSSASSTSRSAARSLSRLRSSSVVVSAGAPAVSGR